MRDCHPERRRREGIPLSPALVTRVDAIARELGIAPLARA